MLIKMWKTAIPLLLSVLIMTACASTVKVQVERTPNLDTSGLRRIAIMPFTASSGRSIYNKMAQFITATARNRIAALNHFTLVEPSTIPQGNENTGQYVDALFSGQVTNVNERVSKIKRQVTDKETGVIRNIFTFRREVKIEFYYYITRISDGGIIGPVYCKGSNFAYDDSRGGLTSSTNLLRAIVNGQLRYLGRDIAPYTVTEDRKLIKEPSKDKELKALMKNAQSELRVGSYEAALESYLGIYARYRNFAAALNASILHEALGQTREAAALMQAEFAKTGNPRAWNELERLNKILEDRAMIEKMYNN